MSFSDLLWQGIGWKALTWMDLAAVLLAGELHLDFFDYRLGWVLEFVCMAQGVYYTGQICIP